MSGRLPASYAQESLGIAKKGIAEVPVEGYDELTVAEVSERLDALSAEELRRVRDYERRNRNRATLLEQIDARTSAAR